MHVSKFYVGRADGLRPLSLPVEASRRTKELRDMNTLVIMFTAKDKRAEEKASTSI